MPFRRIATSLALVAGIGAPLLASADNARSIPSVVVSIENSAPSRGSFQTPFWVGLHDGTFDLYDRGAPLGAEGLVGGDAVERVAEDGAIGPLNAAFAAAQPFATQSILFGPSGPFAPGDRSATTLNVDPQFDRYFSYISMVLPSNDAFIANGSPVAHEIFNERGRFVGKDFAVAGSEVLDAGTELNDEIATNTAFLAQGGPDIGVPEQGVVELHPGFRTDGTFPDGVLTHPVLGVADFTAANYRAATIRFRYVDLGGRVRYQGPLRAAFEVSAELVASKGFGLAWAESNDAATLAVNATYRRLTGPVIMAHLHLGAAGTNGPVVVDLTSAAGAGSLSAAIDAAAITGPLAEEADPMLALLNEMAAGNVYLNIHTEANPAGEIRGQLSLR